MPEGHPAPAYLFGDRDYFNLGGANFSLDYFGPDSRLDGVHPGSIVSPDDYLHTETELLDIFNLYLRDGKAAWLQELVEWGTPAAMRYAPHLVYNRLLNLGFDPTRFSPGLLSKSGYFLLNDSNGPTLDEDGSVPMEREARGARDY